MKAVDRTTRDLAQPEAKDAFAAIHALQIHVDDAVKAAKEEVLAAVREGFERIEARLDARDTLPSSPYSLVMTPPPKDLTPTRSFWTLLRFW